MRVSSSISPRSVLHVMACGHCFQASAPFSIVYSGCAWACSKSTTSCCVEVTPTIVDYDSTNFLKHCFVVSCLFVHKRASHLAIASSTEVSICLCGDSFPCQGWVCQWKPFWIRSKIRSRKPLWKSGSSSAMNLLKDQALSRSLCSITQITVNTSL